jgi:hypothetical protein
MRALGINPLDHRQLKAFKQYEQRLERKKARKKKKRR